MTYLVLPEDFTDADIANLDRTQIFWDLPTAGRRAAMLGDLKPHVVVKLAIVGRYGRFDGSVDR